jgi:hypothetical protein
MDDTRRKPQDGPDTGTGKGRRAFFSRTLLAAGATAALLGLTGCPGGDQGDDSDDGDDGGGNDDD